MNALQLGHRGRLVAAAVAVALTVAAVLLAVVAAVGQQHAASPSPSAANPEQERSSAPSTATESAAGSSSPRSPAGRAPVVGPVMPSSMPVSLDVPKIGISGAKLVQLGLAKDGTIQTPDLGPSSPAGWFRNSPAPGQLGAAVILGHVDSATAGPAIFFRLGTLRPGDTAAVTRADRTVAVFRVVSVEQYAKTSFPTLRVYGDTDHAALRLITCGGTFIPAKQSYEDNIVVYARLVSSHPA